MTRINPNELNDLQLYITTPRCYLVIVYNREHHPLIGRRLENLTPPPWFPPVSRTGREGKRKWSNGVSFHRPERGVFWQEMGTHGIVLSCLRFRNPLSVHGPRGWGRDIGGETIGALARYQCDLRANNLVDEEDGGGVVFVLPACAPFIKRRENWTGGSR